MSMCYWGIVGYGIEISEEIFDVSKSKKYLEGINLYEFEDEENDDDYSFWEFNLLQDLIESLSPYLGYGDSGGMDTGRYLMYFSNNPWSMSDEEKSLTKKDIEDEIVKVLLPLLEDKYDEGWIRDRIYDISVGGAG